MANWVRDLLADNPKLQAMPVHKRTRHGLHFRNPNGSITAYIEGAPAHYQDAKGEWQPIDTALKHYADRDEYGADGLDIRVTAGGAIRKTEHLDAAKTLLETQTVNIGTFNERTARFTSPAALANSAILDNVFARTVGDYKHETILTETGYREVLTIAARPAIHNANLWLMMDTIIPGLDIPDGWIEADIKIGDGWLRLPTAYQADSRIAGDARHYAKKVDGVQHIYTGVNSLWLWDAKYPVIIDPDYTGSTDDGVVHAYGANYAASRATSSYASITDTTIPVGMEHYSTYWNVFRAGLKFDTSGIGSGQVVTQVNLKLQTTASGLSYNFDVQINKQNWAAQEPLTNATKREQFWDGVLAATEDDSLFGNTATVGSNGSHTSGNLDTSWVEMEGVTYYSLINGHDYDNTAPTGYEWIYIATANNATSAYRPVLIVTYEAASEPITGTTAVTLNEVQASASTKQVFTSSGGATLAGLLATISTKEIMAASAGISLADLQAAITGQERLIASGTPVLAKLQAALTGKERFIAALDITLPSIAAALAGKETYAAAIGVTLASLQTSAAAKEAHTAIVDAVLPELQASSSAQEAFSAAVDAILDRLQTGIVSKETLAAAAAVALENIGIAATAKETMAATIEAILSGIDLSAAGKETLTAVVDAALAELQTAIAASIDTAPEAITGALVITLREIGAEAQAVERITVTGTITLQELQSSLAAIERLNASGAVTLSEIAAGITALERLTAGGAVTLPGVGLGLAALERMAATGAITLENVGAAAVALERFAGSAQVTLQGLLAAIAGHLAITGINGSVAATLPNIELSAAALQYIKSLMVAAQAALHNSGTAQAALNELAPMQALLAELAATEAALHMLGTDQSELIDMEVGIT